MRHAGVLRLLREHLFQERRRLELVGVGLVGRQRDGVEGERVEQRRLAVSG